MNDASAAPVELRPLGTAELDEVARLHVLAFPQSALGSLGHEAVVRYYAWLLGGTHEVSALAAWRGGRLVAFLVGGVFHGSTIGFVQAQRWYLARCVLRRPGVVTEGSVRRALALTARLLSRRIRGAEPEQPWRVPEGSFGILAVGVDPTERRRGVGAALLAEAESVAVGAGFSSAHLSVDPSNREALDFYRGLGWERLGLPGDTQRMQLFTKELPRASD